MASAKQVWRGRGMGLGEVRSGSGGASRGLNRRRSCLPGWLATPAALSSGQQQVHQPINGPLLPSRLQGIGISDILEAVVERIPPPKDARNEPLRALIFDSYYDAYKVGCCWAWPCDTILRLRAHSKPWGCRDSGVVARGCWPSLPASLPATHLNVLLPPCHPAPIIPAGRDCAVPRHGRRAPARRPGQVHEHRVRAVCMLATRWV